MKRTILTIIAILALSFSVFAQSVTAVVEKALSDMPSATEDVLEADMQELAAAAPQSVEILAGMLQSAEKGANNKIEYALSGLVNYASTPGNQICQTAVRAGFETAIAKCEDSVNKQFLQTQLAQIQKYVVVKEEVPATSELLSKAKTLAAGKTGQEKCEALYLYEKALGSVDEKIILKALKDTDDKYRMTALRRYAPATDEFAEKVAKKFKSLSYDAKVDVINWMGDNKIQSQLPLILAQMGDSGELAESAIEAAGKIGGDDASDALLSLLSSDKASSALKALKAFPDKIEDKVVATLSGAEGVGLDNLISLASAKHMTGAAKEIVALAENGSESALKALSGVVTCSESEALAGLLDKASDSQIADYAAAFSASIKALEPAQQYESVMASIEKASNASRFYEALAKSGTDEAVEYLQKAFEDGSEAALKALGLTDNYKAAPSLLKAGKAGSEYAISKYAEYVDKFESDAQKKCTAFCEALSNASQSGLKNSILNLLAGVPSAESFAAASTCLDDGKTAHPAADAVKKIASKALESLDPSSVREVLAKATAIYQARGWADDEYAVNEIQNILSKL